MDAVDIAAILLMPAAMTELYAQSRENGARQESNIPGLAAKFAYEAAEAFVVEMKRRKNVS